MAEIVRQAVKAARARRRPCRRHRDRRLLIKRDAALGPVTALINNASALRTRFRSTDFPTERWDSHLDINLRAPPFDQGLCRALPEGHDGNIINLIDQRVWNLTGEFLSYSVSKVGLWGLTQMTAIALAPRIRVNGIGPGPVLPSSRQSAEDFARQSAAHTAGPRRRPRRKFVMPFAIYSVRRSMTGQMIAWTVART